jgi:hypothetical protein
MLTSSAIRMIESPLDRTILADPAVLYRPERVKGKRYNIRVDAPKAQNKSEST